MGGVKGGFTLINEAIKDNGSKVSHVRRSKAVNYENRKKPSMDLCCKIRIGSTGINIMVFYFI